MIITQKMNPTIKTTKVNTFTTGMNPRIMFTTDRPPKKTTELAAFHLTSGSSLPTNRKMSPVSQPRR